MYKPKLFNLMLIDEFIKRGIYAVQPEWQIKFS
jgi:hypothetical protein